MKHSDAAAVQPLPPTHSVPQQKRRDPFSRSPPREALQASYLDQSSPSKRQKIATRDGPAALAIDGNMSKTATPIKIQRSKFQPHTGARRLVIKNARDFAAPNLQPYYDSITAQVKDALEDILNGRRPKQPLERLSRAVEELCRNGQAEALYKHLKTACEARLTEGPLQAISQVLTDGNDISTLRSTHEYWQSWTSKFSQIRSVFSVLDRVFLLNSKLYPQLNDAAISIFREVIFGKAELAESVFRGMCRLVHMDRVGEQDFDSALLKDSIAMLHILDLYRIGFETRILAESEAYFQDFAEKRSTRGLKAYISACVAVISKESSRCDAYNFDSATKRQLLGLIHNTIVKSKSSFLLATATLSDLFRDVDISALGELYQMLVATKISEQLKGPWEEYIRQAGGAIIRDPADSEKMVVRLLEFKRSLDIIIRDAFRKHESFKYSMREAFGSFINDRKNTVAWTSSSLVGEMIAKYIDSLLRLGLKAVPASLVSDNVDRSEAEAMGQASTGDQDAELDRQLENGLELFRFIEGKDVFEAFYKKDLARRLLMNRSASQDAERNMLAKLKSECGSNFTHNLEQMFKDQDLSRDEMIGYKQSLSNTSRTTMDLQVSVLQQAAWPTYPDVHINLPEEVARHLEKFDRYYLRKHTGRKLFHKHSLAHSVVKAQFAKGPKELIVSGFQAVVLVLFNDLGPEGHLEYGDIQKACGLVDAELQRTLQSLACTKVHVLNKHPKGRDVNKTDTFTVNTTFTDPKLRVKINQIQLKETKEENKATHERVSADRQYETQAAIVRIMKSRKKMTHANLVSEVINQTKSRGAVEVSEIKKNIEILIEKDYLERDGNSYEYQA